jgi:myo-inositol-1(or 4)-monophosphatase
MAAASPSEEDLLSVARVAAGAAGEELMARFRRDPIDVRSKSTPTDPVSAADLAAEAAIRAVLARERPGDAVLGEEGGATSSDSATGLRWVVDPLDGTVNYLYGITAFAVSIACEDESGTLAGLVLDPATGETFAATRSGPATLGGEPIHGSNCDELSRTLVATGFGYAASIREAQGRVVVRLLPRVRDVRRAGAAALDLCACACGRTDAYFERGLNHWDWAAGALICERAGLVVRPLGPRDGLPSGIVVAPGAIIDELEALVAPGPDSA